MTGGIKRIAMVSMHTSPIARPGTADSGGMNVTLVAIAGELAHRGVEVDLVTRAVGGASATELMPGVVLHELEAGESSPLRKEQLAEAADEFGEQLARLVRRGSQRTDLIHAHYWLSGIAALPVALEQGIPFVQSFHTLAAMKNLAAGDALEPDRRLHSERYLAGQADAVIAGSAAEATALIERVGAPSGRVWVVPPGVDLGVFAPSAADWHAEGRALLAVAGRIQPFKGQELAIRALAELRSLGSPVPLLVVAGEPTPGDEDYADGLRELAAELGVGDDVRFVGALDRPTLAALLAAADLTLVPSFSETFGLVALESAACGTPVIASRVAGLLESVADGESGILLDSREPEDWARAIAALLGDRELLTRLGVGARSHAEQYSWAASAASLLGVYASLARG